MSKPTYVGETHSPYDFSTTDVVPALSSVQAGDVLVAFAHSSNSGSNNPAIVRVTAPAGWTRIGAAATSFNARTEVWTKVATGPLAQETWTWGTSHWTNTAVVAYRGVSAAPTTASMTAVVATSTTTTAVSPTSDGIVVFTGHKTATGSTSGFSGVTKRLDFTDGTRDTEIGESDSGAAKTWSGGSSGNTIVGAVVLEGTFEPTFEWMGSTWVKRPSSESGGPTYNGAWEARNVVPNPDGTVTLNITNPTGNSPISAEFYSEQDGWGYGTYQTTIQTRLDTLDKAVVFGGLFTYDKNLPPSHNEIDICESSAWGGGPLQNWAVVTSHVHWKNVDGVNTNVNNGQYNATSDAVVTHRMKWEPGKITYESFVGDGTDGPLLMRSVATDNVPVPAKEKVHFNLWVFNLDNPPADTPPTSVTIRSMSFEPYIPARTPENDSIRLEVEVVPDGLPNMVKNPSGADGAWGWLTPVSGTKVIANDAPSLSLTTTATQAVYTTTDYLRVNAGRYVAARLDFISASTNVTLRPRFDFYDATRTFLSSAAQGADLVAGTNYVTGVAAPAGTSYVRLRLDMYLSGGNPVSGNIATFNNVMVTHAADSATLSTTRTNLIPNPSFETNRSGWSDFSGGTSMARTTSKYVEGTASVQVTANNSSVYVLGAETDGGTDGILVTGGQTYTLQGMVFGSLNRVARARIIWYKANGAEISQSRGPQVLISGSEWHLVTKTATAPSNAKYCSVEFQYEDPKGPRAGTTETFYLDKVMLEASRDVQPYFDGSTTDTATVSYSWTGTVNNSTSIRVDSATAYPFVEPYYWRDISGPTTEIKVTREELDVGSLSATIYDAAIDPSEGDIIRPDRALRLLGKVNGEWEAIFTGTVTNAHVSYRTDIPASEPKSAKVILTANDAIADLANIGQPSGVEHVSELPHVLEPASVPYNINGSGDQVGSVSVVSVNENASVLDQLAVTRDSNHAHAWVDRNGVLQVRDAAGAGNMVGNPSFETDLSWWAAPTHFTATRITSDSKHGSAALRLQSTGTGLPVFQSILSNLSTLVPGDAYVYSAWVKASGPLSQDYLPLVEFYNAGGVYLSERRGAPIVTDGEWNHVSIATPAPVGATQAIVYIIGAGTTTSTDDLLYVDDVGFFHNPVTLTEYDYNQDIDISFNTDDCINEVLVKWLRYKPTKNITKEIVYGPYRDEASIAEWGPRSATFTVQGAWESEESMQAFADAVLLANAVPTVRVNSLEIPIKATNGDLNALVLLDLYDVARVTHQQRSIEQFSHVQRITHDITPYGWFITVGFTETGTVAPPQVVPAPPLNQKVEDAPPEPIQTGVVTVPNDGDGVWSSQWVDYPIAFSAPPTIVATFNPTSGPGTGIRVDVAVAEIDRWGFNVWVVKDGAAADTRVMWIAVPPES